MKTDYFEKSADSIIDVFEHTRQRKELSHENLAKKACLHRSTISLILNKKRMPTIATCLKIAAALEIKLSDVLKKSGL